MPVTMKEIAAYAGVSTATVSLSLQGKGCVAKATGARVRELATRLGYTPSGLGRALQSGRSGLIGYLLGSVAHSYFNEVMQGVGGEAARRGYGLLTALVDNSEREVTGQLKIFKEKRIDGLLVSDGCLVGLATLLDFEQAGCPVVFCSVESPLPGVPAAVTDDFLGGQLAARHLAGHGARRLAYFNPRRMENRRFDGCVAEAARLGLSQVVQINGEEELRLALASGGERPDALFCYSDEAAAAARDIALARGLDMPGDLMIVGFDDSAIASLPGYRLSSLAPRKRDIGRRAVELLFERIEGKTVENVRLAPLLVERESSAR